MSADDALLERMARGRRDGLTGRARVVRDAVVLVARSTPRLLVVTLVLQVLTAASTVATVAVAAQLVNSVVHLPTSTSRAVWLLLALTAITVVSAAASVVSGRVQRVMGEAVGRSVWARVLSVASEAPLTAYDSADFSERLSRVQEHAVGRPHQVVTAVSSLVAGALGALGLLGYLVGVHWSLPLLVVVAGIPALLGVRVTSRHEYRFAREVTTLYRLRLYTAQLLSGRDAAKELRAYGFGGWLRERHDGLHADFLARLARHSRDQAVRQTTAVVLGALLGSLALLVLLLLVGSGMVGVGSAAGAALALRLLTGRVQDLVGGTGQIYESALFLEDLHTLSGCLRLAAQSPPSPGPSPPADRLSTLTLAGASFTYAGATTASVETVDLQVRTGQVVAVVGENGSGKTTMAKLVCHLYRPSSGRVLWNDVQVEGTEALAAVRRRIAVLFQDFGRYAFSAADNVYVGGVERRGDAMRLADAAARAGADDVVPRLRDGWDTLLAAEYGGQDLSLGQWQRMALARAHFRDADLIVLDEPTAALDPRAEARLFDDVRRVLADKAVLLITHRLASARTADTIVVMQRGKVVERGDHDQLMAMRGVYAELWDLQAAGYAVEDPGSAPAPAL